MGNYFTNICKHFNFGSRALGAQNPSSKKSSAIMTKNNCRQKLRPGI